MIKQFHVQMTSIQFYHCDVCSEQFPTLSVTVSLANGASKCRKCVSDKHNIISKLYLAANNMDPGPVPPLLLVRNSISLVAVRMLSVCILYLFFRD